MVYIPYANQDYYTNIYKGNIIPTDDIDKALKVASRHIDSLTFNRIQSLDNLTEFQNDIVQEVCCSLAEFETENANLINSILSGYSINGVSVSMDKSWNLEIINGIAIPTSFYRELAQTGLTCRSFNY